MYCTKCGAERKGEANFCMRCGSPFVKIAPGAPKPDNSKPVPNETFTEPSKTEPTEKRRVNWVPIVFAIMTMMAISVVLFVIIFSYFENKKYEKTDHSVESEEEETLMYLFGEPEEETEAETEVSYGIGKVIDEEEPEEETHENLYDGAPLRMDEINKALIENFGSEVLDTYSLEYAEGDIYTRTNPDDMWYIEINLISGHVKHCNSRGVILEEFTITR